MRAPSADAHGLQPHDVTRLVLSIGAKAVVVAVTFQSFAHLVNYAVFDLTIHNLDADQEATVFSWASASVTFAGAVMAVLLAVAQPGRRWRFALLSALLAFFSLDDAVSVHEKLGEVGEDLASARLLWPVLYIPLLAAAFLLLWALTQDALPPARRFVRLGLAMLVTAVALEMGSAALVSGDRNGHILYELEVVAEEGLELGAWILISSALAAVVCLQVAEIGDTAARAEVSDD